MKSNNFLISCSIFAHKVSLFSALQAARSADLVVDIIYNEKVKKKLSLKVVIDIYKTYKHITSEPDYIA